VKIIVWVYRLGGGGAERVMTDLASSFAEVRHDVQLCVHGPDNPYAAELSPKVTLRTLTTSDTIRKLRLRTPLSFIRLLCLIRKYKPDVVFTTGAGHGLQLPLLRWLSFSSFTTVLRETNTLSFQKKKSTNPITRLIIYFAKFLYPLNDYVVATSEGVEADLLTLIPALKGRIIRIANPVDTGKLRLKSSEPLTDTYLSDKSYILAVGRLVPQKGFDVLIHAWAEIYKKYPYKLVILGEGAERPPLLALAKSYGLEDSLIMPGFRQNPFAYMARTKLFVLSSYHEGLPNVLLQALACGCPVVSTDCPSGPSEILQDGRLAPLVPVGDARALAGGMLDALENASRYPSAPWNEIAAQYDPGAIRNAYLSLFEKGSA
jgi:glycosyltransferase involved in cell wall biosynthesis